MALFGKKKVDKIKCDCESNVDVSADSTTKVVQDDGASVKILGSGCKKCNELENNTKSALAQLGMDTTIDYVTDFTQIESYGVMTTPALVVKGKVASYGKVLKTDEIVRLLQKTRA